MWYLILFVLSVIYFLMGYYLARFLAFNPPPNNDITRLGLAGMVGIVSTMAFAMPVFYWSVLLLNFFGIVDPAFMQTFLSISLLFSISLPFIVYFRALPKKTFFVG